MESENIVISTCELPPEKVPVPKCSLCDKVLLYREYRAYHFIINPYFKMRSKYIFTRRQRISKKEVRKIIVRKIYMEDEGRFGPIVLCHDCDRKNNCQSISDIFDPLMKAQAEIDNICWGASTEEEDIQESIIYVNESFSLDTREAKLIKQMDYTADRLKCF